MSPPLARMAGHRVYLDTNVFIYFLQRDEVFFPIAAEILKACAEGTILGTTGDLAVAEVMVHSVPQGGTPRSLPGASSFSGRRIF